MNKKKPQQSIRDACVREIVEEMKKDNWNVKADLPDFEKPPKISGFYPDILASKKGCVNRICEVITEDMFEGDKKKYIEIKNYCDEYDMRFFVVGKDGKRMQIDPQEFGKKESDKSYESLHPNK